jgi:hypothetical protein
MDGQIQCADDECPISEFLRAGETQKQVAFYSRESVRPHAGDETNFLGRSGQATGKKPCAGGPVTKKFMHPQLIYSNVYTNLLIFHVSFSR